MSKIIHSMKNLAENFPKEHHFRPWSFNVTCQFRILDIPSFRKIMVKHNYGKVHGGLSGPRIIIQIPLTVVCASELPARIYLKYVLVSRAISSDGRYLDPP